MDGRRGEGTRLPRIAGGRGGREKDRADGRSRWIPVGKRLALCHRNQRRWLQGEAGLGMRRGWQNLGFAVGGTDKSCQALSAWCLTETGCEGYGGAELQLCGDNVGTRAGSLANAT